MALHQGKSLRELSRISEREFLQWARYAGTYMLPQRRIELMLAQIAMLIAKTMGGSTDATLQDFLFDPPEVVPPEEQLDAAIEAFQFSPRKRKAKHDA